MKTIGIASDHAGFELKQYVKEWLKAQGWDYKDFGTFTTDSCDYPVYGEKVARAVVAGEVEKGSFDLRNRDLESLSQRIK